MQIQDYNNEENILEKFGRNLTEEVKNGKMDPVIGRDDEIRNIIMILSRKTKNNPVLILTRDLLFAYWKSHNYLIHYFIFYFFMKLAAEKYNEEWNSIPFFSDLPPHILQRELFTKYSDERMAQLERMSDIHKLTYKFTDESNLKKLGTFYKKIMESYCGKTDAIKIIGGGYKSRVKISSCMFSARNYGECA